MNLIYILINIFTLTKMKETVCGPNQCLPTTLAFEKEKAMPHNFMRDLAEGFIVVKTRSSTGSLLKCHGSRQVSRGNDPLHGISVLVGTRDAIHNWLRLCGPGKSILWIEHGFSKGNCHEGHDSSLVSLELVYRQRDYRFTHVHVLHGCKLALFASKPTRTKKNKVVEVGEDGRDLDWSGLGDQEFKLASHIDTKETSTIMQWHILMKAIAFKKLNTMLAHGGALWEFRRLLLQVILLLF